MVLRVDHALMELHVMCNESLSQFRIFLVVRECHYCCQIELNSLRLLIGKVELGSSCASKDAAGATAQPSSNITTTHMEQIDAIVFGPNDDESS